MEQGNIGIEAGRDIGLQQGRTLGLEQEDIGEQGDIGVGARKVLGGGEQIGAGDAGIAAGNASHWSRVWGLCFGAGGQCMAGTPSWGCVGFAGLCSGR